MMKLKSLKKKLRRLKASLQKDAKRLDKLQRKVEEAIKVSSMPAKGGSKPVRSSPSPPKKKRKLTPEGRAKLAALMNARWAAKRGQIVGEIAPVSEPPPDLSGFSTQQAS